MSFGVQEPSRPRQAATHARTVNPSSHWPGKSGLDNAVIARRASAFLVAAFTGGLAYAQTPPDPPANVYVVPGNGKVWVNFAPPVSDGGSPITGYMATCTPSGTSDSIANSGTSSPIPLNGLSNGVTYSCAVSAANDIGESSQGPAINIARPTAADAISADNLHTCAVTSGGGLKCWGSNGYGQLGGCCGVQPVDVVGMSSDVVSVAAGGSHTCALSATGGVKCWGDNAYGQVGDGTTTRRYEPVDVAGLTSGVVGISADSRFTCALTASGGIKCWGFNDYGQLGSAGTNTLPVDIAGMTSGVIAVTAGGSHICALTDTNAVKCWGRNDYGQLGRGTTTTLEHSPMEVMGLANDIVALTAGDLHTCALTSNGGIKCWGGNQAGQLGAAVGTRSSVPVDVTGLVNGIGAIATGNDHTCAITTGGSAKCWGSNLFGKLANSAGGGFNPTDVVGLTTGVVAIAGADYHTCALMTNGGVKCWGANGSRQLGDGSDPDVVPFRYTPGDVATLGDLTVIVPPASMVTLSSATLNGTTNPIGLNAVGWFRYTTVDPGTCSDSFGTRVPAADGISIGAGMALTGFSEAIIGLSPTTTYYYCAFVRNTNGTYTSAVGSFITSGLPDPPADVFSVPANQKIWVNFTVPLNNGGSEIAGYTASCTPAGGGDGVSQFGISSPLAVEGLANGIRYNCTVQTSNGIGTSAPALAINVAVPTAAHVLGAGGDHSCALTARNGVKCWGLNSNGQLGNGSVATQAVPANVDGLSNGIAAVSAGGQHTCALTMTGGVKCWGYNHHGQLGDGTTTDRLTPTDVLGLATGVVAITGRDFHSCALMAAGGVKCWGTTPTDVSGLTSGVVAVAAGGGLVSTHSCALNTAGGVKCWGYNNYGQLGDGTLTAQPTPVDVYGLTSGVASIATGSDHSCAVTNSGGLKCWGDNFDGRLGDGTTTHRSRPVDVYGLSSGVAMAAAGFWNTCALTVAGGLKCWGNNYYGQIGDGTIVERRAPVTVSSMTSGTLAVSVGHGHICAYTATGSFKCWGRNTNSQLGEGTSAYHREPTDVLGFQPPSVSSGSASAVETVAATLTGEANPNGDNTVGWFRYSTVDPGTCSDSFGTRVPTTDSISIGAGMALTGFSEAIVGLSSSTTYYFCAIASNANGMTYGGVSSFSTPAPPTIPGAPTLARILPGNGEMRVYFTPPASDGGATVLGYTATCRIGAETQSAIGTGSPITVSGLTNGVGYTCSVSATNSVGTSEPSVEATMIVRPIGLIPILMLLGR
jgi:alpha-tubulin suppressor-like RCC1 family protein